MTPNADGIHTIDTGFLRPGFDAAYLLIEQGRAAFIDCGLNSSVPRMLAALDERGLSVDAVDWLILTHIHLDHAGGAGELMTRLPNARLVVHPRGQRHMVDPTALVAGATEVYGAEEVQRTYGVLRPIPTERIDVAHDDHVVELAGRELRCLDAPGHARHHIVIYDERSRSFFSGDCFGLSYRDLDGPSGIYILPTTTPVQFEPEAMKATLERMLAHAPQTIYLTHFGPVSPPEPLAQALVEQIDAMVAIANAHADADDRHAAICADLADLYIRRAQATGNGLSAERIRELLAMDIELNAQGLGVWLDRGRP